MNDIEKGIVFDYDSNLLKIKAIKEVSSEILPKILKYNKEPPWEKLADWILKVIEEEKYVTIYQTL